MTLDVEPPRTAPRVRKISRRTKRVLVALAALVLVLTGYFARFGMCEAQSKFCVVDIIGTRSEIGFEWDTPAFYVSTYPGG